MFSRSSIGGIELPGESMPEHMTDPDAVYQAVRDELMFDANVRLNLATFSTTWMEPQAQQLMIDSLDRNLIDVHQYPSTAAMEKRCLSILANLWHDPDHVPTGVSSSGSSEAAMIAGLALKWCWRRQRGGSGHDTERPNLVLPTTAQVCWTKFCRYWDVETRYVPISTGCLTMDPARTVAACDENTIGVVPALGATTHGLYDPIADIAAALDDLQNRTGLDIPIHVDGASGGFIAPFLDPDLVWDFRLPRVQSINASGHKFGMTPLSVGWTLWRQDSGLPQGLAFEVDYLGGECQGDDIRTLGLTFSRSGAPVVVQYYNFARLGHQGYQLVHSASRDVATYLAARLAELGTITVLSDGSQLPVVTIRGSSPHLPFTMYDVAKSLSRAGWQVPAYAMPADLTDVGILRFVVRNGFSHLLADHLITDIREAIR
jgi:glutamate decarboxylase